MTMIRCCCCPMKNKRVASTSMSLSSSWMTIVSFVLLILLTPYDGDISNTIGYVTNRFQNVLFLLIGRIRLLGPMQIQLLSPTNQTDSNNHDSFLYHPYHLSYETTIRNNNRNNKISKMIVHGYSVKGDPYIYPTSYEPPNSSFPVQDYRSPFTLKEDLFMDRPKFIYDPEPNVYRIVEFYVHWCGRCRAFKSHYIAITRRVVELAKQQPGQPGGYKVQVHAISCTPNKPLCLAQGIKGYPKMKLFKAGETEGMFIPFESFAPFTIMERLGIPTPSEDELDEWDINGAIADAEVDMNGLPISSGQGDASDERHLNDNFGYTIIEDPTTFSRILDWLVPIDVDSHKAIGLTYSNLPIEERTKLDFIYNHKRSRLELKDDVHLAFDFVMRNGIYIEDGPLSDERRVALHSFLNLLTHTIPATWSAFHKLLEELTIDFHYVIKTETYLHGVLDDHPVIGNITEWSPACTHGGDPSLGFTCGMWELLHTATIGTIHYNQIAERPLGTEMVGRTIKDFIKYFFPCDVCRENFIKQYDACEYNRCTRLTHEHSHVKKPKTKEDLYKTDKEQDSEILKNVYNITEGMELPLWLWEVHNGVNIRLLHERVQAENDKRLWLRKNLNSGNKQTNRTRISTEPIVVTPENEMDVVWPSRVDCPSCWVVNLSSTILKDVDGEETTGNIVLTTAAILEYNREHISKYLLYEYGAEMSDEVLAFHKKNVDDSRKEQYRYEEHVHSRYLQYRNEQHSKQVRTGLLYGFFALLILFLGVYGFINYMAIQQKLAKQGPRGIKKNK